MAGNELGAWLLSFLEGTLSAESIYQAITDEARPIALAVHRAKKQKVDARVEVNGESMLKLEAESRLNILRRMQEAALQDALEESARKKKGLEERERERKSRSTR
jgi:hypothetical protein